jgi:hypothetical protein
MFTFEELIKQVLEEDNVAGGDSSAFGPGVASTSTQFSGDNYAKGRADRPFAIGKGTVIKRNKIPATIFTGKSKKKKKKK